MHDAKNIKKFVESKIKKQLSSHGLVANLRSDKKLDNNDDYLIFYFLGKIINPNSIVAYSPCSGIELACFLNGCKISEIVCISSFDKKLIPNVRSVYKDNISLYSNVYIAIDEFIKKKFEVFLIFNMSNYDEARESLETFWNYSLSGSIFLINRMNSNNKVVIDFCRSKNINFEVINSRFGLGIFVK
jgi:hypothetical protein